MRLKVELSRLKTLIEQEKEKENGILRDLYIYGENLYSINFSGLTLENVEFDRCNLDLCKFNNAELLSTDFNTCIINRIYFGTCKIKKVDFIRCLLDEVYFTNSSFDNVDFDFSTLLDVKLPERENIRRGVILKEDLIGYKKGRNAEIITLLIPKGSVVFSINNNKCRTNRAKVLEIKNSFGRNVETAISDFDHTFVYKVGQSYEIDNFDTRYNIECGTGIHFFKTLEEAIQY